VPTTVEL
jgi:CRP-like cAMP-binding protein